MGKIRHYFINETFGVQSFNIFITNREIDIKTCNVKIQGALDGPYNAISFQNDRQESSTKSFEIVERRTD